MSFLQQRELLLWEVKYGSQQKKLLQSMKSYKTLRKIYKHKERKAYPSSCLFSSFRLVLVVKNLLPELRSAHLPLQMIRKCLQSFGYKKEDNNNI